MSCLLVFGGAVACIDGRDGAYGYKRICRSAMRATKVVSSVIYNYIGTGFITVTDSRTRRSSCTD